MSAVISPCGLYRYRLDRDVPLEGPFNPSTVLFIGVNPSTANADEDDATIRKMVGFAKRWGYSHITVVNLFAYRATDVRQLGKVTDLMGPLWFNHVRQALNSADLVVPCWGSRNKLPKTLRGNPDSMMQLLINKAVRLAHLGLTERGDPRHPLRLGYDTPLRPFGGQL